MGRPCFLWRNVSFLRMNLDGAAPVRLTLVPWSRVWREVCRKSAAGTLKIQDGQTLFHFTGKSTGLGLAACNQNTIIAAQLVMLEICANSALKKIWNQSTNKQAALLLLEFRKGKCKITHTHISVCELSIIIVACFHSLWLSIIYPVDRSDL